MYILEGNIGTGKSTFLNLLRQQYPVIATELEPIDAWQKEKYGKSLLTNFYTDPHRWALSMETFTLQNRVPHHLEDQKKVAPLIVERSIYSGHYCFAHNSYQSGFMTDMEWQMYLSIHKTLTNGHCKAPLGFIYMRADPNISMQRIKKRNRVGEGLIPFDYIQDIHWRHELFLIHKRGVSQDIVDTPVLILDCNQDFEADPTIMNSFAHLVTKFIAYTREQ